MITAEATQMKVIKDVTFKDAPDYIRRLNIPLTRHLRIELHDLEEPKKEPSMQEGMDPVIAEFLRNIDNIAVHTGITDLADQHDHYLYGLPKHK
jgi:hypothetical protein